MNTGKPGMDKWSFEVELEIKDINHLIANSRDPNQFRSVIRRFLQNAASLTNLMDACIHEVDLKKNHYAQELEKQTRKEQQMLAEHKQDLRFAF